MKTPTLPSFIVKMPIVDSPYGTVEVPVVPAHKVLFPAFAHHAHLGRTALINGVNGDKYSYGQLLEISKKVGSGLAKLGLSKGDVICIYSPNSPEWVFTLFGAMFAGLTISPANPAYTPVELKRQIIDCGAKYVVTIFELMSRVEQAMQGTTCQNVILLKGTSQNTITLQTLMNDNGSLFDKLEEYKYNPKEDLITLPYSSGTTGLPKGVMITHYNMVAQIEQMAFHPNMIDQEARAAGKTQTVMAVLPFYHAYGLVAIITRGLAGGGAMVILPKFQPESFLSAIEKYKVTLLPIVPPIAVFLAKSPLVSKYDLSSVQTIGCGAAPLTSETETQMKDRCHVPVVRQGWGMTETNVSAITLSAIDTQKAGSVGKPVPSVQAKILDPETGKSLGPHQRGELLVRGPQIMKGYLNNPEATRNSITPEGWLHTGDIGYYDEDKYFYIVDRIKELIKVKGFQVPPAELESLLLTHTGVADVGVIGIPNEESGELPRAFVVTKPGASVSEADIMKFVAEHTTYYKHLKGGVVFLSQIPKSPSGKILRRSLREMTAKSKL